MHKKIICRINPETEEIEWEVNGVKGTDCKVITDALTRGEKVVEAKVTDEFYDGGEFEMVRTGD